MRPSTEGWQNGVAEEAVEWALNHFKLPCSNVSYSRNSLLIRKVAQHAIGYAKTFLPVVTFIIIIIIGGGVM